jgi:Fe-S-cluster-containing dehydrogenase component
MHWIRVDQLFLRLQKMHLYDCSSANVPCMHCENAPCEQVCPVNATVHDKEGLNAMAYNRCIGTRYCSNNCPYKVRTIQFLQLHEGHAASSANGRTIRTSPVRFRGVMEKCTYCTQRIITASSVNSQTWKNGPVRDGEIKTACRTSMPCRMHYIRQHINDPK